jgi:hypothetical protein
VQKAFLLLAVLAVVLFSRPLSAQSPSWNDGRVLELVARARELRQRNTVDSSFQSYHTSGRGFVYFFFDRNDTHEQTLVKTDQVALDLWWKAPEETRQRIVGLRDAKSLPTNIRYHLDHLTVVQDEFADVIRIGDGDEVSAVAHPVAPGAESKYDFRLIDSLTITSPGTAPVRVYKIDVRPKNLRAPGFVGQLYLDQASSAIVRMSFTFTASSYVDKSLDRITISLDNSLWEGKYWLPYRQEVEVRREVPIFDLVGGSVIRARFEIGAYDINAPLPAERFAPGAPRITAAPPEERAEFPFEVPMYSQLEVEGLRPPPSFEEIQEQARELIEDRYLTGISKLRLYLPSTSEAIRYDRAEGFYAGGGIALRWIPATTMRVQVGYATGTEHVSGSVALTGLDAGEAEPEVIVFARQLRDMGPVPGSTWLLNSLSSLINHEDHLDPYYATGLSGSLPFRLGPLDLRIGATLEEQRSANLEVGNQHGEFRPVRSIDDGDVAAADLGVMLRPDGAAWRIGVSGRVASFELLGPGPVVDEAASVAGSSALRGSTIFGRSTYSTVRVETAWEKDAAWQTLKLALDASAGAVTEDAPSQELFLLGGRETLLGHPFRELVGDRFWLARGSASRPIKAPWVTGRVFASAGAAELADHTLPRGWSGDGNAPVKGSVGAGVSLFWDVVNLDVGRGLGSGGKWGFALSASKKFRRWM